MNADELRVIVEEHAKWLNGQGGERANLRGADLEGAKLWYSGLQYVDLRGANLRDACFWYVNLWCADMWGAKLNWQSHELVAELLRRAAGEDVERLKVAGLVLMRREWCWRQFLALDDPLREWALRELARWVQPGDIVPEAVQQYATGNDDGSTVYDDSDLLKASWKEIDTKLLAEGETSND